MKRNSGAAERVPDYKLQEFQRQVGYVFQDEQLLISALRHSSVQGRSVHYFDRLEFLGDRVLNMLVAKRLYKTFPNDTEGDLSNRYTSLVCYETCAEIAKAIGLDQVLSVAPGTTFEDMRILGDAMEALLGAMFLDGGLQPCENFVENYWRDRIMKPVHPPQDAKSALQEWAQAHGKPLPVYEVINKTGSEHEPLFTVEVTVEGLPPAQGQGTCKKLAEKKAAERMLEGVKG